MRAVRARPAASAAEKKGSGAAAAAKSNRPAVRKKVKRARDRSKTRSSAVSQAAKRVKAEPQAAPPAADPSTPLAFVDEAADLDVFTKYLHANVLRCDDVMFGGSWAWVKGAPFVPFPRKQSPRVMANNLYSICEELHRTIGLEMLYSYAHILWINSISSTTLCFPDNL